MRWTAFAMAGIGLLVVHLAVGALGGPDAAAWLPDPFIWLLLFPVLWGSAAEAITAAWLLGLLRDLVHPDPFGLHSLMLGCAAFPAWQLRHGFDVERPSARILTAAALACTYAAGLATVRWWMGDAGLGEAAWRALLPIAVTAAAAPWAVRGLRQLGFLAQLQKRKRFLGVV